MVMFHCIILLYLPVTILYTLSYVLLCHTLICKTLPHLYCDDFVSMQYVIILEEFRTQTTCLSACYYKRLMDKR